MLTHEQELAIVYKNASNGIINIRLDGQIEKANPSAKRIFQTEDLVGVNIKRFIDPTKHEVHDNYMAKFAKSDLQVLNMNNRTAVECITNFGNRIFLDFTIIKIFNQEHVLIYYIGIFEDDSKVYLANKILQKEVKQKSEILTKLTGSFFDYTLSGGGQKKLLTISPNLLLMFGRNPKTTDIRDYDLDVWFSLIHPDDRTEAKKRLDNYIADQIPRVHESTYRMRSDDKQWIPVRVRSIGGWNEEGELMYLTGAVEDLRSAFNELESEKFKQFKVRKSITRKYLYQKSSNLGLILIIVSLGLFITFGRGKDISVDEWSQLLNTIPSVLTGLFGVWQLIKKPSETDVERRIKYDENES